MKKTDKIDKRLYAACVFAGMVLFGVFLYRLYPYYGHNMENNPVLRKISFGVLIGAVCVDSILTIRGAIKSDDNEILTFDWIVRALVALTCILSETCMRIYAFIASWLAVIACKSLEIPTHWWRHRFERYMTSVDLMHICGCIVMCIPVLIGLGVFFIIANIYYMLVVLKGILIVYALAELSAGSIGCNSANSSNGYSTQSSESYDTGADLGDIAMTAIIASAIVEHDVERRIMIEKDPMSEFRP